jgi:hypothetical protein
MSYSIPNYNRGRICYVGKSFEFDIKKYYTERRAYLEAQLRIKNHNFTQFDDDTAIDKTINI